MYSLVIDFNNLKDMATFITFYFSLNFAFELYNNNLINMLIISNTKLSVILKAKFFIKCQNEMARTDFPG
jgi:hypothetical protein